MIKLLVSGYINWSKSGSQLTQMQLFSNINSHTDFFFWKYIKTSKWYVNPFSLDVDFSPKTRCIEKLQNDIAFLNIIISENDVSVATLSPKYDLIDQLAISGNLHLICAYFMLVPINQFYFITRRNSWSMGRIQSGIRGRNIVLDVCCYNEEEHKETSSVKGYIFFKKKSSHLI